MRNKEKEPVPVEVTEEKEEKKKEVSPSYERFHTLSQAVDGTLPLPHTYKLLGEIFRCTDTVMGMLHNRREIVTLEKIKKAVQEMLKKDLKKRSSNKSSGFSRPATNTSGRKRWGSLATGRTSTSCTWPSTPTTRWTCRRTGPWTTSSRRS